MLLLLRRCLKCMCCQWLAPEKLRGCGAILLNSSGQRFVDELNTRDKVTEAIMEQVGSAVLPAGVVFHFCVLFLCLKIFNFLDNFLGFFTGGSMAQTPKPFNVCHRCGAASPVAVHLGAAGRSRLCRTMLLHWNVSCPSVK